MFPTESDLQPTSRGPPEGQGVGGGVLERAAIPYLISRMLLMIYCLLHTLSKNISSEARVTASFQPF